MCEDRMCKQVQLSGKWDVSNVTMTMAHNEW